MGETTVPSRRTTRCSIVSAPKGSIALGSPMRLDLPPHRTMPATIMASVYDDTRGHLESALPHPGRLWPCNLCGAPAVYCCQFDTSINLTVVCMHAPGPRSS